MPHYSVLSNSFYTGTEVSMRQLEARHEKQMRILVSTAFEVERLETRKHVFFKT